MTKMIKRKIKYDDYVILLSRIFISGIFLMAGIHKIMNPSLIKDYMASAGMVGVELFYYSAVIFLMAGGLFILTGYKLEVGALMLAMFLIPATLIFHLDFTSGAQIISLQKNIAILGGLFALYTVGPGKIKLGK